MGKAQLKQWPMVERRKMRDFIFRHLYLLRQRQQDIMVLRYGLLLGRRRDLSWSEIEGMASTARAESIHNDALRRIALYTTDANPPLLLLEPTADIAAMKERARLAARSALGCGEIVREPCRRCGNGKSEMHHPDYRRPLHVEWLCKKCHGRAHTRMEEAARALGRTWAQPKETNP